MTTRTTIETAAPRRRRLAWLLPGVLAMAVSGAALAQSLPLTPLPDDDQRDFWWFHQVQDAADLEAFRAVMAEPGVPMANPPAEPIRIAIIFPSQNVSDFWERGHISLKARLDEMGIPYDIQTFASTSFDHLQQASFGEMVLQADFDYVVYGPAELGAQAANIKSIIDQGDKQVIVWNYDTVLKRWGDEQPLAYVTFSHLDGAANVCRYIIEKLGPEGSFALMRGTPGSLDDQRSGGFRDCMLENSNWEFAYEHYGMAFPEAGFQGGEAIAHSYPEVTLIHSGNTAVAMAAAAGAVSAGAGERIHVTGWGGTGDELVGIRDGRLLATPMRMADDMGIATAEVIRHHLEGKPTPLVVLGRITIAHGDLSDEEIDALERESFKYSGVGTLER